MAKKIFDENAELVTRHGGCDEQKNYPIDATLSDVVNKKCPILCAMRVIGSKWKLPLIWYLHEKENTRYNELKRRIPGITNIMLIKSLREMEADGLVTRREIISEPPKVAEYSLTEFGKELIPALNELYAWGQKIFRNEP